MIGPRTIEIIPPKEAGLLLLERMTGGETLGRPFEFDVDVLSKNGDIKIPDVLGKPFSLVLSRTLHPPRWFNGIVSRFALVGWTGEHFRYQAKLRPLLWLLTRTSNSRIFQGKNVPDVIMKILGDHGVTAKKQLGRESYAPWEYLVQYNETDFNFVSRLMEQEGIHYYFLHEDGKHTVVLVDALTVHDKLPGHEEIPFSNAGERSVALGEYEHIDNWGLSLQIKPGAYAAKEFDFERPRAPLLSIASAPNPHDHAAAEKFEYPGRYIADGERQDYADRRLEEQQVEYEQVEGTGNARGLMPGFLFTLTSHPSGAQNREYLVTGAFYALTSNQHGSGGEDTGPDYRCTFSGIPSKRPYRSLVTTPKPLVTGPQTAIVVGPKGEEIFPDKYGRVKVQFHWDRQGKRDENSSCWVRVSQVWAGSQWGAMHIPRIGQEVLVDFLEGDPDRPVITGRLYNADNMPPYKLPDNKSQSGIKSRSTLGGSPSNFNELRFEDKKGEEQVYLQAEKDLEILVKHDEHRLVDHDRMKDVTNDETTTVGGNRTETVKKDETITIHGNRTETVDKNEDITVSGNRTETVTKSEMVTIVLTRTHDVGAAESLSVSGSRTVSVGGSESTTVSGGHSLEVNKDQSISITGGRALNIKKDDSVTIMGKWTEKITKEGSLTVGKKLLIDAADEITLKSGKSSIVLKKDGTITIKGKDISIDAGGKVNVKATGDVIIKGSKIAQN